MTADKRTRTASAAASDPGTEVSFEEALERLERLVERLEEGRVPLEESLAAYAEGTRLVKLCLEKLEKAELLIKELGESAGEIRLTGSPLQDASEDEGGRDDDEETRASDQDDLPF